MTSLDDLLSYDDEPSRHGSDRWRTWLRMVAVVGSCALGAYAIQSAFEVLDYAVAFPIAFGVALAVVFLRMMVNRVGAGSVPLTLLKTPLRPPAFEYVTTDGIHDGVRRWQTRLDWAGRDAVRFARTTQPALVELIDERLRLRHGLSRGGDPERARDLLGPDLWNFVTEPVSRRPSARDLARLVAAMEEL